MEKNSGIHEETNLSEPLDLESHYTAVASFLDGDFHSDIKPFICTLCAQCFNIENDLKEHFLDAHKPGKGLKIAKPVMKPREDFTCEICHVSFERKRDYKQHTYTHAQKEKGLHQCTVCSKILKTKLILNRHMLIHERQELELDQQHSPKKKQRKQHQSQSELDQDIKTNHDTNTPNVHPSKEDTHFCDICEKTLSKKTSMALHMATHSEERAFHCVLCDQSFRTRHTLRQHLVKHSDHKPYPCPHCELRFRRKNELSNHIRVHSGEKPFACTEPGCDRAFRKQSDLSRHLLVHTGGKPHQCPHCEKAFRQKGGLRTHLRTHNGDKPHACPECPLPFRTRGNLFSHIRFNHANPQDIIARIQKRPKTYEAVTKGTGEGEQGVVGSVVKIECDNGDVEGESNELGYLNDNGVESLMNANLCDIDIKCDIKIKVENS